MLYTLAQLGFKVDIMRYGMNVIMDVMNLSVELNEANKKKTDGGDEAPYVDLNAPVSLGG